MNTVSGDQSHFSMAAIDTILPKWIIQALNTWDTSLNTIMISIAFTNTVVE